MWRRPGARGGRSGFARRSRFELREAACEERAVASRGSSGSPSFPCRGRPACPASPRAASLFRPASRRAACPSRPAAPLADPASPHAAFPSRPCAPRASRPSPGGAAPSRRRGRACRRSGAGRAAAAHAEAAGAAAARSGEAAGGRRPGRPEVPSPPERSGLPAEPPEEPDEAVSPRIPSDDVVGALGGGEGASEAVFGGGEAVRASATISPACAVPRSGAGRLSRGRSPGRIIGASASSVMTALSATVQRACVPRRLPTVVPSAELPSDLNGSPRLRRLEPLKSSGFLAKLPHSPAPAPRAHPAASGSTGCC